jgi:ABC-2 type transport system ATP-binding protein
MEASPTLASQTAAHTKTVSSHRAGEPVIRVRGLRKRFRLWTDRPSSFKSVLVVLLKGKLNIGGAQTFAALDGVDFDIYPGEFVGIMGRNGAGKSTLMKLISGIYTPTSGEIKIRGTIAPLIELGAGFHPDLSGYENIFLNAAVLGFGRQATQAALPAILEFSELGDKVHAPVKTYSSGMLVRLGFSVATHLEAPILLIDEVLAVGDVAFQQKCLRKIEELHQSGRTIILITHGPDAVEKHCTRCIVIDRHVKIFDGSAAEGAQVYKKTLGL